MAKTSLPDINVNTGSIVDEAKGALEARSKIAEFTTIEKEHSEEVANLAVLKRIEEANRNNFIGVVRVTGESMQPVRVEMRLDGALDVSEKDNLNKLYGNAMNVLFARTKVVQSINNPMALINQLINEGKDPLSCLDITVKKGQDNMLLHSENVTTEEAILPKEGFLNKLNEVKHTLSSDALTYTRAYLDAALKPRVILGSKGGS